VGVGFRYLSRFFKVGSVFGILKYRYTGSVFRLLSGDIHRRRKGSVVGGGHHGECGARAYNRGLGAQPPAGVQGRAPGQGVRGAKPP